MQDEQDWTDGLVLRLHLTCLQVELTGLWQVGKMKSSFSCWFFIVCLVVFLFVNIYVSTAWLISAGIACYKRGGDLNNFPSVILSRKEPCPGALSRGSRGKPLRGLFGED